MRVVTNTADRTCNLLLANEAEIASMQSAGVHYSLHCLTSVEEIQAIRDDWKGLEQYSPDPFSYFQSFDWCFQWCLSKLEQDRTDRETSLCVYVLRHQDSIVMIWPMMEIKTRIGARILTFLTDPLSQYSSILADHKLVCKETGREVWNLICKHTNTDAVTIDRYPSESLLEASLHDTGFKEKSHNEASFLDLTEFKTWDDHHASLSRNQRKQRNRRRSKLGKQGELTYEVCYGGSARYIEHLSKALEMKQDWLKNTGRSSSVLAQSDTMNFLGSLSGVETGPSGFPEGAVSHALCIDGTPIAVEIGMVMQRHYYSYLGAFDWAWGDYSPGKVQIEEAQKWAKSVGLEKFDFLGDPADYKEQWTSAAHRMHSRSLPKTALGYLYCGVWKSRLRPQLKSVYKNMGTDKRKLSWKMLKAAGRPTSKQVGDR